MVLCRSMGADEALANDLRLLERDAFDIDQATRDISWLETSLFRVRNLLSNQAAIIHCLLQQPQKSAELCAQDVSNPQFLQEEEGTKSSKWGQQFPELLDNLQILLAEKKTHKALDELEKGRVFFDENAPQKSEAAVIALNLKSMKERLAEELANSTMKASVCGVELRDTCSVLQKLGEGSRAHDLLLVSHRNRLLYNIKGLCRSKSSYGGAYTAALSQLAFSAISLALKDSAAVFNGNFSCGSELVLWARDITQEFVTLLKKYVLSSLAAAGGLRAAAECVHMALGHCFLLETQGLAICPYLSSLLKPSVEEAVSANVVRIGDNVIALAAADDWNLIQPLHDQRMGGRASYRTAEGIYVRLSSSAHTFNILIELAHSALEALCKIYERYVDLLIDALLPDGQILQKGNIKLAKTMSQKLVVLGNATALSEDILPKVSRSLLQCQESFNSSIDDEQQKEWKLYLQHTCEKLKSTICNILIKDILYDKDRELLTPDLYSEAADPEWQQNPFPSSPFEFVLDMQFVIEIATERSCTSDVMYKVVAGNIALASNAFALNGQDPMRFLN
ncbi:exocyst complex component EXO84B [Selaginella moellendorffii]|uniref:exocyst complex component EXO84B n=1 Tax=Selaginella moellendorffii TaxID=88036 RepID=UPI000D1C71C1|nr:exocyst complex component EXO84B [Selaginella moellendorffii]|eukprot:XP_024530436.1 exocyst complex component EXO84B [Selaginella moellendorffii]